jgi:MFS family permease
MKVANESEAAQRTGVFYGWVVVGCVFVLLFLAFGVTYTIGAFFQAFQQEFAANRADVSLVFAISGFLYFALGIITGPLAGKFGVRIVTLAGVLIMSVGLMLASLATSLWQVYLTYSLSVGLGVGLIYVPTVATVQQWFIRQRGLASGIGTAGIGAGTLLLPPLATALIGLAGWRNAYLIIGGLVIVFGLVSAFLLVSTPQKRGLLPDGEPPSTLLENAPKAPVGGATLKEALTSRSFWILYIAAALVSFGVFIPFVHLAPYAQDKGLGDATGAWLIGLIGVGSTVGRFTVGGWADKWGRRQSAAGAYLAIGTMMFWWLFADALWSLVIFALVFGLSYGGFVALAPALTADYFGRRSISTIIGYYYSSVAFGALLGPTLAGLLFDLNKSYVVPIIVSAVLAILGGIMILLAPKPENGG